jgi:phospho-N-acetylmuramoyl-pentapeptide-transferase
MVQLLGLVLISFAITSVLMVPFIDFLFSLKRRYERIEVEKVDKSEIPITNKLLSGDKDQTPIGGGVLIIIVLTLLSLTYVFIARPTDTTTLKILLFTLLSFGAIGMVDDIAWIKTKRKGKFLGLSRKTILIFQLLLATLIASMLYYWVGINNLYITGFGNFVIGPMFIPLAVFTIIAFSNAYNISDGLDGLSTGLLAICLFALLALASASLNLPLAAFIGIWIGALFAFLYFNVFPARIILGDAGAFGFGATLAVVGLLSGKIIGLGIIGGVYVIIVASSLIQIFSKRVLRKKVFPVSPIHMYFRYIGWEEPKVVMRFWLAGAIFAILGLWLSLLSH